MDGIDDGTSASEAERFLVGDGGEPTWDAFVPWLVHEADPDERHRVVMNWNWDDGTQALSWIGSRSDCDRATALLLFWNGAPEHYLAVDWDRSRVPDYDRAAFDFVVDIRRRWREGRYTRAELAFSLNDAVTWPRDFAGLQAQFGERVDLELPHDMRAPLAGRVLDPADYLQGIPSRFWRPELR